MNGSWHAWQWRMAGVVAHDFVATQLGGRPSYPCIGIIVVGLSNLPRPFIKQRNKRSQKHITENFNLAAV
ncbi:hypothetical protein WN943_020513 [Citrus x changshan-huyou]